MKITIEYHSIWQNSFLDIDCKHKESKPNKWKFTATSKQKERISAPITKNTVLGVLCRLMGDQRKLSTIRKSDDYFFKDKEDKITFSINKRKEKVFTETAFIVNKSDKRPAQSTFIGVLPDDTPLFFSATAPQLWSVLYLPIDRLIEFILSGADYVPDNDSDFSSPKKILSQIHRISEIDTILSLDKKHDDLMVTLNKLEKKFSDQKEKFNKIKNPTKAIIRTFKKQEQKYEQEKMLLDRTANKLKTSTERELDKQQKEYIRKLDAKFPGEKSYLNNGYIYPIGLYAAALYLQAERMILTGKNLDYCVETSGEIGIKGFSKRGFNGTRDFLNKLAGGKTKTIGTPYPLNKSDGVLDIKLNINNKLSEKINTYIENAGVSSFYLGKKGLAYVSNIRV